ncbi:MAG: glycosyltransferase [Thermoplasmata archaeon]
MVNENSLTISVVSSTTYPSRRATIYGSEVENFLLAEELGKMGNNVYFYGASGSEKSNYFKKFRYLHSMTSSVSFDDEYHVVQYYSDELAESDIIIDLSALLLAAEWAYFWGNKPFITVRNGTDLNAPRLFRYRNTVVLSSLVQKLYPNIPLKIIPYGIDEEFYSLNEHIDDRYYYLYLARPTPSKGIFQFLEIAKRMPDEQFKISFSTPAEEHRFYGNQILELLPDNVTYVHGDEDFDGKIKVDLYKHAKALIIPLQNYYKEAFGLNMCEAMSTGTAFISNAYSVSTDQWAGSKAIFTDGDTNSYVKALRNYVIPDPISVREFVLKHYTKEIMAEHYMALIRSVIAGERW